MCLLPSAVGEDTVDRLGRRLDDDIRFLAGEAKRWRKTENVALGHGAADDATFQERCCDLWADLLGRIEEPAIVLVLHEFHGGHEPVAADFADMLVAGNGLGQFERK